MSHLMTYPDWLVHIAKRWPEVGDKVIHNMRNTTVTEYDSTTSPYTRISNFYVGLKKTKYERKINTLLVLSESPIPSLSFSDWESIYMDKLKIKTKKISSQWHVTKMENGIHYLVNGDGTRKDFLQGILAYEPKVSVLGTIKVPITISEINYLKSIKDDVQTALGY